jgi:isocitrate lyase
MEDMFVVPRTREGFYHYTGGVEVKLFSVLQFLCLMFDVQLIRPHLTVLRHLLLTRTFFGWKPNHRILNRPDILLVRLERSTPESTPLDSLLLGAHLISYARWFVYNLSPSFNWSQHGFTGECVFVQAWLSTDRV